MKSYLGLVKEYGKIHKKKTRITITCIAIAVCLVTTIFGLAETMIKGQRISQSKIQGNWHVAFRDIKDETATQIGNSKEVKASGWLSTSSTKTARLQNTDIPIMGVDEKISENMGLILKEGVYPKNSNESLIDANLKEKLNISINDKFNVSLSDGNVYEIIITGTYENTSMQLKEDSHGFVLTRNGLQEIDPDTKYIYYVEFHKNVNMRKTIDTFVENLKLTKDQVSENAVLLGLSGQSTDNYMVSIYITAFVLFLLVIIAGILMISSSFNMSIRERTQFFGLMRCLGASTSQIKKYVLLESIRLCLIGIPVGLLVGVVITTVSCAFLKFVNSVFFGDLPLFQLSLLSIICGIMVGLLTVTLAAIRPAIKASKVSPQSAISGNIDSNKSRKRNKRVTIKKTFHMLQMKPEITLGVSHALSDKKNILLMTGSFAMSIILFLCFSLLISFMELGITGLKPYTPDIVISSNNKSNTIDRTILEQITNIKGVKCTYGRQIKTNVPITEADKKAKITLVTYELNQFKWAKEALLSGSIDDAMNKKNMVLAVHTGESGLQTGDTFTIKAVNGKQTLQVAGVISESPYKGNKKDKVIICSEKLFKEITGEEQYAIIDTQLKRDANEETVTKLQELTTSQQQFSDRRKSNSEGKTSYYSFALFVYAFLTIIASITVFNIINSMNNSVSSKINRYGVMRAIGMSGDQLHKMVIIEAATYAISGCIVGILVTLPIHGTLYNMIITARWGLEWKIPYIPILIILAITMFSTAISVIQPVKRLNKMSMIEAIKAQ